MSLSLRIIVSALQQLILIVCLLLPVAHAQDLNADNPSEDQSNSQSAAQNNELSVILRRLDYVQNVLNDKLQQRSVLGERIEAANEQDKADLRRQADALTADIQQLRSTFESIAIGGVDTSLFTQQSADETSDWREDITLIAQPVIDSLKELTEKPRKLKELTDLINLRLQERDTAQRALDNLAPPLEATDSELNEALQRLVDTWKSRRDDAQSAIEIARFQIADLRGDKTISESVLEAFNNFVTGRGLTLLLAGLSASAVYLLVRFLLRGYRAALIKGHTAESRTRYRLAAYSVHALTFTLVLIAVFVVFYERGDVLLLGLLILLIVGLALGIRQLLPRYVAEARLLLNIGAMRETERVYYKGLPWRVESINMYTVLRNPELDGQLRIPLAEFHGVNSRPVDGDDWFPTSAGDVVLMGDKRLLQVLRQNPDTVQLRERGGQGQSIPSQEFYTTTMTNLTRSGSFGVSSRFGLDYELQAISLTTVPDKLKTAVSKALHASSMSEQVKQVEVELLEAGTSSIDYWIFVTMAASAAWWYHDVRRIIQAACIDACTEQSWTIPFPHVSLIQKT